MFAPAHHQATRYVVPVRRQLAVRTIFNFLGPLTNPAGATRQLIGVSDPAYLETMAGALALLGTKHALLVASDDGLDELSISAPTQVVEVLGSDLERYAISPEDVGLERSPAEQVPGGTPEQNAQTARSIFAGEPGAARGLALLNAGAAIYAGGAAATLEEGVRAAEAAVDDGSAQAALERFVARTRELARVNRLDPILEATRAEVGRRRESVPVAVARAPSRGRRPVVRRRSGSPRAVGDRRAQAPLALGRRDPRRPRARGCGERLRTGRRGRRCRSSPTVRASAARSTICAPPAPPPGCRHCARTSSSTPTRCTSRSRPVPTRSC